MKKIIILAFLFASVASAQSPRAMEIKYGAKADSLMKLTAGGAAGIIHPVTDKGGQVFNVQAYGAKGNGTTNDAASIRSAIAAAGPRGIVYFPKGVYFTDTLCITQPVTLTSNGAWLVFADTNAQHQPTMIHINSDSVTIDGLNFNGNRTAEFNQYGKPPGAIIWAWKDSAAIQNVKILNCRFKNSGKAAIFFDGAQYCSIIGNTIDSCRSNYDFAMGRSNVITLLDAGNDGAGNGTGTGNIGSEYNIISNNIVRTPRNPSGCAIEIIYGAIGNIVSNNIVTGFGGTDTSLAITVAGRNDSSYGNIINNNATDGWISLDMVSNSTCTGNTVTATSYVKIGIEVVNSPYVTVTGNSISFLASSTSSQTGIILDASPSSVVAGNTIHNAQYGNTSGGTNSAIDVATSSSRSVVSGNLIHKSGRGGILVDGSAGLIDGVIIAGNSIDSCTWFGVKVTGTKNYNVNANIIQDNGIGQGTSAIAGIVIASNGVLPDTQVVGMIGNNWFTGNNIDATPATITFPVTTFGNGGELTTLSAHTSGLISADSIWVNNQSFVDAWRNVSAASITGIGFGIGNISNIGSHIYLYSDTRLGSPFSLGKYHADSTSGQRWQFLIDDSTEALYIRPVDNYDGHLIISPGGTQTAKFDLTPSNGNLTIAGTFKPTGMATFDGGATITTGQSIYLASDNKPRISAGTDGAIGLNYNTGGAGTFGYYGGGTGAVFSVTSAGVGTFASTVDATGYKTATVTGYLFGTSGKSATDFWGIGTAAGQISVLGDKTAFSPAMYIKNGSDSVQVYTRTQTVNGVTIHLVVTD